MLGNQGPSKSPGLKKTPTSSTVKGMGEKRERAKRLPKAPQTVEVYYRIYQPPVSDETETKALDENEEHKGAEDG